MERDKLVAINFLPFKINGYVSLPYIICWGKLKMWKVWNGKFALTRCQESASDFLGMIPPRPLPLLSHILATWPNHYGVTGRAKRNGKKLDGKRLIFHLTQYLQQNWWYHKEMIVCINQNKIQKCKTGNLERRVRAELTLNVGDVASPTWTWRWCIVSGCLVFCHFLVNKFVIRKCRCRRGDKYQVRILGTWKVRTVRWQPHLFVCRLS